jgi:2,4-dienoyl-CoA reductase-like NADH-dependent reductase (Old Yellow Enzyme family)
MQERQARNASNLFTPVEVGPLTLKNRVVMAPLTRQAQWTSFHEKWLRADSDAART